MEQTLKILSWVGIVFGSLAIVGSLIYPDQDSLYGLMGGVIFLSQGWAALAYIKEVNKK